MHTDQASHSEADAGAKQSTGLSSGHTAIMIVEQSSVRMNGAISFCCGAEGMGLSQELQSFAHQAKHMLLDLLP